MTIALLTLILLGYMKVTGKTLPAVEKRLNKVKNSKKRGKTELSVVSEIEFSDINVKKLENISFKRRNFSTLYSKTFSGSLKI